MAQRHFTVSANVNIYHIVTNAASQLFDIRVSKAVEAVQNCCCNEKPVMHTHA
jgi:hypothetical protein